MIEKHDAEYRKQKIYKYDSKVDDIFLKTNDRVEISEELVNGLRHFVEAITCYIRINNDKKIITNTYNDKQESKRYCKSIERFNFLSLLLDNLNSSSGHDDYYGEYAERLFIKYYHSLIKIKIIFKKEFSIEILKTIEKYPMDLDNTFISYYRKILEILDKKDISRNLNGCDCYYILKKKMIYVDEKIFFEYTLTMALDFSNKNDRFLASSILDIPDNYAIKARFITKKITIFKQETDCNIITGFSVAIRPCELEKIAYILGYEYRINRTKEYWNLMNFFNNGGIPLNKIIELSKKEYDIVMNSIFRDNKKSMLYKIINKSRVYTKQKSVGSNVLKYLLYKLNNKIISLQIAKSSDDSFNKIKLSKRTYSFDKAPLSMCPINHVPSFKDLLEVFDFQEHKNEIISRTISLASIDSSCIYLSEERVKTTNLDDIIASYNSQYMKPSLEGRKIMRYGKYLYLNENELNTVNVLKIILNFSKKENFVDYSNFINSKIIEKQFIFTDPIKEAALKRMFDKSSVFIVYGPAGSGKSYFAKYVLNSLEDLNNVCIATTNPAVENMRRKFENSKARYLTITKFLSEYNLFTKIDLLIIDECSAVSTKDINDILTKTKPKLLLLLGDTYQIKPITFGNCFSLLTYFVDCSKYVILNNQYRCDTDSFLLTLRNEVRELKNNIKEYLSSNEISHILEDENSLFKKESDDEIILCLNYDGLYGINNINRIFQKKNNHKEYKWKQYLFKEGDPIVFNDSTIYKNVFYNNLKGRILHIVENDLNFVFTVKIERNVSSIACAANNINYIGIDGNGTIVSFEIKKFDENYYDNDSTGNTHIPFQIAYALSIHKAQGLEYDSVKIIISNEVEENITHSVFYTAITRAKRILNIYWTPETEEKIISNFYIENCKNDANILKAKYQELKA